MSSIKYQLYVDGVMRLAQSIILKDESVAEAVNADVTIRGLATGYVVDLQRPETWKYYLNLAGRYHLMDTPMTIVSLDTMESISFDTETLKTHRATVRAYRQDSRYYNELVERYPDQEVLISGILNPVDLTTAITAPNYTILYFDSAEVEPQETDLILRLQNWIYAFVRRWYIRDYQITDNLFNPAFLGTLYAQLPGVIMNLRQDAVRTYRAHSFHVWSYLESTGRLSRFRGYLTEEQQMWLYRNIRWVFLNSGKQETFEALVENLLTKRSIPLGHYQHRVNLTGITTDLYGKAEFERNPLNLFEIVTRAKPIRSIDYVLEKEMPLARDNKLYLEEHQALANDQFSKTFTQEGPARVMESEMLDRSELLPITLKEFQIQHWFYLAASGKYNATITISNPYTTEFLRMSVKDAALLWYFIGIKINGIQLIEIPPIVARVVRRMPLPTRSVLRGRVGPLVTDAEITTILGDHEPIRNIISTEAFYDLTEIMHQTYLKQRVYHNNEQHHFKRAELEMTIMGCYQDYVCKFTNHTTFDAYFTSLGWNINEIPLADLKLMFDQMSKVALGADLKDVKSVRDIQTAMLQMMRQLGAYTTQIIQNINTQPATIVDNPTIRLGTLNTVQKNTIQVDNKGSEPIGFKNVLKDSAQLEIFDTSLVSLAYMKEKLKASYQLTAKSNVRTGVREIIRVRTPEILVFPRFTGRDTVDSWEDIPDGNFVEPSYDIKFVIQSPGLELSGEMVFNTQQKEQLDFAVFGTIEHDGLLDFEIFQQQTEDFGVYGTLDLDATIDFTASEELTVNVVDIQHLNAPQLGNVYFEDRYTTDVVVSAPYPYFIDNDIAAASPFAVTAVLVDSFTGASDVVVTEKTIDVSEFTVTSTVLRNTVTDIGLLANTSEINELTIQRVAVRPSGIADNALLSNASEITELTIIRQANRKSIETDIAGASAFAVTVVITTV